MDLALFVLLAFMQGEVRPAGSGPEACGQARLSLSWIQISLDVAAAGGAEQGGEMKMPQPLSAL